LDPRSEEDEEALLQCFHNGWLHADKLSSPGREDDAVYTFPSPLHHLFVEWKLYDIVPVKPIESNNILEFALEVIARFSPRLLSAERRRIGDGCILRPPEAQYQDEFYRSCYTYSGGLLTTFSEYGTAKGRVDFYIPSKEWAVELLRDGDRLEQHSRRILPTGPYGGKLALSEYIILDCRSTRPKVPHGICILCPSIHFPFFKLTLHTDIANLYHVVFSNNYRNVSVLDKSLQPVNGGELRLLYST